MSDQRSIDFSRMIDDDKCGDCRRVVAMGAAEARTRSRLDIPNIVCLGKYPPARHVETRNSSNFVGTPKKKMLRLNTCGSACAVASFADPDEVSGAVMAPAWGTYGARSVTVRADSVSPSSPRFCRAMSLAAYRALSTKTRWISWIRGRVGGSAIQVIKARIHL